MQNEEKSLSGMFHSLEFFEAVEILVFAVTNRIEMSGVTETQKAIVVHPSPEGASQSSIQGDLEGSFPNSDASTSVLMSFVIEEKKYLFKAEMIKHEGQQVVLNIKSKIYSLQRRKSERMRVPERYFTLAKLTHVNGQPITGFAVLYDASANGLSILTKSGFNNFKNGDWVRMTLSIKKREPQHIDFVVKHTKPVPKGDYVGQIVGGVLHPDGGVELQRLMNAIFLDLCREFMADLEKGAA